jgi:hypothetical protein
LGVLGLVGLVGLLGLLREDADRRHEYAGGRRGER